jgi:hypothetical protein
VQLTKSFLARLFDLDEAEITHIDGLKFDLSRGTEGLKLNDLLVDRHKTKMQALATALESEDDLGKVVRGHIHIEHELQQVIFFAAPSPEQLKPFERQEFSEKVQLALMLGLKPDLAPPLNAAGNLRNKFAHRLDTMLNREMAQNLVAALPPTLKVRFEALLSNALASPAWKAQLEARFGRPLPELPELAHPFDLLKGEARTHAEARMDVIVFFLCLFEELANERLRFAVEKLQRGEYGRAIEALRRTCKNTRDGVGNCGDGPIGKPAGA